MQNVFAMYPPSPHFFLLGAFSKIVNSDYEFRPVCPSVRVERLGSYATDFQDILYFANFPKICQENSRFVKI